VEDIPFGRGVWIGGNQGTTIQKNVVRGTSNGGIVISSDTTFFPGPGAHDITIANNVLQSNLGPQASGSGSAIALGAIIVESTDATNNFAATSPNTNISITGNYIADSGRSGYDLLHRRAQRQWLGSVRHHYRRGHYFWGDSGHCVTGWSSEWCQFRGWGRRSW